jgi:hypothetical protein
MISNQPESSLIIKNGIKIIHTKYPDNTEQVEEYDNDLLISRKFKKESAIGKPVWDMK